VGTPLYMSPEHISGQPFDRAADIWAFGCTIFETMGLACPWSELLDQHGGLLGGMEELLHAVTTSSLNVAPLREHYSEGLCNQIGALLTRDLAQRTPLQTFLDQLGRLHSPYPPPEALDIGTAAAREAARAAAVAKAAGGGAEAAEAAHGGKEGEEGEEGESAASQEADPTFEAPGVAAVAVAQEPDPQAVTQNSLPEDGAEAEQRTTHQGQEEMATETEAQQTATTEVQVAAAPADVDTSVLQRDVSADTERGAEGS
jgi:hypothetical protein